MEGYNNNIPYFTQYQSTCVILSYETTSTELKKFGTFVPAENDNKVAFYNSPMKAVILTKEMDLKKMKSLAVKAFKIKHWSTDSEFHVMRHEIAHALWETLYKIDKNFENKIDKLRRLMSTTFTKDKRKECLSTRGFTSPKECFSESYAQYLNGTATRFVKSVFNIFFSKGKYND